MRRFLRLWAFALAVAALLPAGRLASADGAAARQRFLEESARPSGSRTVGTTTTSPGRSRSAASRRTTATCCASLRPK